MIDDYSLLLILNGATKVTIWGLGAAFAFWRRRGLLACGFGLACLISAGRALADAELPGAAHVNVLAYGATPAAGLIVASFVGRQPHKAPRPARWAL